MLNHWGLFDEKDMKLFVPDDSGVVLDAVLVQFDAKQ